MKACKGKSRNEVKAISKQFTRRHKREQIKQLDKECHQFKMYKLAPRKVNATIVVERVSLASTNLRKTTRHISS